MSISFLGIVEDALLSEQKVYLPHILPMPFIMSAFRLTPKLGALYDI